MKNLISFIQKQQHLEVKTHQDSYLTQLQHPESLKTFILNNKEIKTLKAELIECSQSHLLICALNRKSYLFYMYKTYTLLRKTMPFSKLPYNFTFINPQQLAAIVPNRYQIISAHYFSFIPTTNVTLSQQIEFIGQRWFAKFANCYVVLYKKNNS